MRLYRAVVGSRDAAAASVGDDQSEIVDRAARCVHARDRGRRGGVRSDLAGYHGPLYAEICPQTFPILVRKGRRCRRSGSAWAMPTEPDGGSEQLQATVGLVSGGVVDIDNGIALSVDLKGDGRGWSDTGPSGIRASSMSMRRVHARSSTTGSRSRRAGRRG